MRTKLLIPSLVVVMLGIAACGSSSSSSSSTPSASTPSSTPATTTPATKAKKGKTAKKATTKAAVPSRTYSVKMTGAAETPAGAPKGTGAAVIALHGKTLQVCWRFAHLAGFTGATFAHIHVGPKGTSGNIVVPLSTGTSFLHKGCVAANAALIAAIEKNPHGYYVNIHSKSYPGGAVRAQL
jgi:hypothetical protein